MEPAVEISEFTSHVPVLIVLRGLPGSGKSTLAEKLLAQAREANHTVCHCAADKFFVNKDTGRYKYNAHKLGEAHAWCLGEVIDGLKLRTAVIVVDNTHISRWEYANVVRLAEAWAYKTRIIEVRPSVKGSTEQLDSDRLHSAEVANCAKKNIHGAGHHVVAAMASRWEHDPAANVVRSWECPALEAEHEVTAPPKKKAKSEPDMGLALTLCDQVKQRPAFAGASTGAHEAACALLRHLAMNTSAQIQKLYDTELLAGFISICVSWCGKLTLAVAIPARASLTDELTMRAHGVDLGPDCARFFLLGIHGLDGSMALYNVEGSLDSLKAPPPWPCAGSAAVGRAGTVGAATT